MKPGIYDLRFAICALLPLASVLSAADAPVEVAAVHKRHTPVTVTRVSRTIDLATALRLAGAQNLVVVIAREKVKDDVALGGRGRESYLSFISSVMGYISQDSQNK
jgi:hypothetical protein